MHAPPGDHRYWECWGPQQLLDSRPRAEYRPPRTQGICGWCEKKPAVSRRRCEGCQKGDGETERAADCRTDNGRASTARENQRNMEVLGAKMRHLKYKLRKLDGKLASLLSLNEQIFAQKSLCSVETCHLSPREVLMAFAGSGQ